MLPPPQLRLWRELGATPESFTLYGGTALTLRLGHRASVDFDFFSNTPFDPERLASTLPYLRHAERIQIAEARCSCPSSVDSGSDKSRRETKSRTWRCMWRPCWILPAPRWPSCKSA